MFVHAFARYECFSSMYRLFCEIVGRLRGVLHVPNHEISLTCVLWENMFYHGRALGIVAAVWWSVCCGLGCSEVEAFLCAYLE